ncbi:MAG: hypothetical protein BroJett011_61960 [Chloroflexota bacterium]|nr:MAG: hypothetical protein BroJett011_61960 [Chloroflexota bacterium]
MKKRLFLSLVLGLLLCLLLVLPALADEPIIGEIRLWPTDNPPPGWLICDGSTLYTDEYPYLFQTIYWIYGGYTGEENQFKIPDFRGRVPVGWDASKSEFDGYGETGGEISHTLTINEMPSHSHIQNAHNHSQNPHNHTVYGTLTSAAGTARRTLVGVAAGNDNSISADTTATNNPATATNQNTGGGQPHNNLQPYLTLNFIIYTGVGGPTPTPTITPQPTATPQTMTGTTYLPNLSVYTDTLDSGKTLTQPVQVSFGQIIIAGLVLATVAVVALQMAFGVVFRR